MKKSGVDVYRGAGRDQVQIEPSGDVLQGKNIILAPRQIPNVSYDTQKIIN